MVTPEILRAYMMGAATPETAQRWSGKPLKNDLHRDKSTAKVSKNTIISSSENFEILQEQLQQSLQALDTAILQGAKEIRLIHGKGQQKLQRELHRLLSEHRQVRSYRLSKDKGSTWVILR